MTEGHVVSFIGWLQDERKASTRRVAAASISQYISAIRTLHKMYTDEPPPQFPFFDVVLRSYKKMGRGEVSRSRSPLWNQSRNLTEGMAFRNSYAPHDDSAGLYATRLHVLVWGPARELVLSLLEKKAFLHRPTAYNLDARCGKVVRIVAKDWLPFIPIWAFIRRWISLPDGKDYALSTLASTPFQKSP